MGGVTVKSHHMTLACVVLGCLAVTTNGHGRLWDPPSRSSMWRQGYNTPVNNEDNELNCGGLKHQLQLGYKCGICGDPYDGPRDNEEGGKYATGTITRVYKQGQRVTFKVDITANHKGSFEFKLCPTNNANIRTTQECLDQHPLTLADESGAKYTVPSEKCQMFEVSVTLPRDLTCDLCVLQWRYHAGNGYGVDPDGRGCLGCGPQEEFYGCADIKIVPDSVPAAAYLTSRSQPTPVNNQYGSIVTGNNQYGSLSTGNNQYGSQLNGQGQYGSQLNSQGQFGSQLNSQGQYGSTVPGSIPSGNTVNGGQKVCRGMPGPNNYDQWCQINCLMRNCPQNICICENKSYQYVSGTKGCRATGLFSKVPGQDQWCVLNCAANNCPPSMCVC